jgi:hypothetical protein
MEKNDTEEDLNSLSHLEKKDASLMGSVLEGGAAD